MNNKQKADIKKALDAVNVRIDRALDKALRSPEGLATVAVTKRQPLAVVRAAYDLGLRHFGENQIQEGIPKVRAMPDDITWHFIGHLQKNKVRKAVKYFKYLHGVDSMSLLTRIDAIALEERLSPRVFLQVNYARDAAKYGLHPEEVEPVLETALELENLTCVGLMGIPPELSDDQQAGEYFEGMREMRDRLRTQYPQWPGQLSMGMSHDFELAIGSDAHYIRLGTVLFGARS